MKYQVGDLVKVPEDKYSPEELIIITRIDLQHCYYHFYDVQTGQIADDFYICEYLDEVGEKVG